MLAQKSDLSVNDALTLVTKRLRAVKAATKLSLKARWRIRYRSHSPRHVVQGIFEEPGEIFLVWLKEFRLELLLEKSWLIEFGRKAYLESQGRGDRVHTFARF